MDSLACIASSLQENKDSNFESSKNTRIKNSSIFNPELPCHIQSIFQKSNNIRVFEDDTDVGIISIQDYLNRKTHLSLNGRKYYAYYFENGSLAGVSDVEINPMKSYSKKYRKDKTTGEKVEDNSEVTVRGKIIGISQKARKRMLDICSSIDKAKISEREVLFLTLTYGRNIQEKDYKESKKHLNNFNMNLKNLFKSGQLKKSDGSTATLDDSFWLWRVEKMQSGRLHFHFCIFGARFICKEWIHNKWSSIVGVKSRTDIQNAKGWTNTSKYFSKTLAYLTKTQSLQDVKAVMGRHYGLVNRAGYKNNTNLVIRELTRKTYTKIKRTLINLIIRVNKQKGRWTVSYCKKMKKVFSAPNKRNFSRYIDSNVFERLVDLFCTNGEVMNVGHLKLVDCEN